MGLGGTPGSALVGDLKTILLVRRRVGIMGPAQKCSERDLILRHVGWTHRMVVVTHPFCSPRNQTRSPIHRSWAYPFPQPGLLYDMVHRYDTLAMYDKISRIESGHASSGQTEKSAHHGLDIDSHLYQVFDLSHSANAHRSL